MNSSLDDAADRVAAALQLTQVRLVLAESCTAGLIAATLARVPGISEYLCGSAVVYRNATKEAWLGVPHGLLDDPRIGPVSAQCAEAMARGVLERTPEATLALAITGHLGPGAPAALDGIVHVAIVRRPRMSDRQGADTTLQERLQLTAAPGDAVETRHARQRAAAEGALVRLLAYLAALPQA